MHPGYGFLAERAAFAEAVEQAGLTWIGPPPVAIRAMGDKTEARRRMRDAGVPIVPGASAPVDDIGPALGLAREVGYPVMVKAAAGGGGKGMRVVRTPEELPGALESAASEALKAFGDASVYLEKFIERPRHVEIQVLADDEPHDPPGRARVLDPAAAPEAGRGSAVGGRRPRAARVDGRRRRVRRRGRRGTAARAPASSCSRPTARSTSSR